MNKEVTSAARSEFYEDESRKVFLKHSLGFHISTSHHHLFLKVWGMGGVRGGGPYAPQVSEVLFEFAVKDTLT
jgi:hypothetical protein